MTKLNEIKITLTGKVERISYCEGVTTIVLEGNDIEIDIDDKHELETETHVIISGVLESVYSDAYDQSIMEIEQAKITIIKPEEKEPETQKAPFNAIGMQDKDLVDLFKKEVKIIDVSYRHGVMPTDLSQCEIDTVINYSDADSFDEYPVNQVEFEISRVSVLGNFNLNLIYNFETKEIESVSY